VAVEPERLARQVLAAFGRAEEAVYGRAVGDDAIEPLLSAAAASPPTPGAPQPAEAEPPEATAPQAGFRQTLTWWRLSLVNGSRRQPAQRASSRKPAISAMRSSSDGQT